MFLKIPRFRQIFSAVAVCSVAWLASCGSYNGGRSGGATSGLTFRVFVSNPVHPNVSGGGSPALNILDASRDLLSPYTVSLSTLSANVTDAGMMSLSPNHDRTLVMSPRDSKLAVVDNVKEAIVGTFTLPGGSDSFFISSDNNTAFAAVPSAPINGQAPGAVLKISSSSGTTDATIPIAAAHYLAQTSSGNQILVFSDNIDSVVLVTPGLIGASGQPTTISQCTTTQVPACILPANFDRPIGAIFDPSGTKAYVINCGLECGGANAGITAIDMTNTGTGSLVLGNIPLAASTAAFLQGNKLYVAGNDLTAQPGQGGTLSVLDLSGGLGSVNCLASTPSNCQVAGITDGYHTLMQLGANGRLFIGSKACSSLCLTIFDTVKSQVVAPPKNSPNGDVTGIAPIPNRNMVYVCQGTLLRVYDTSTDQLANIPQYGQPNLAGDAVDVKVIDF